MNLRALDQILLLHRDEALALRDSLRMYHQLLTWRSGQRQLFLSETMSIRATLRVHDKLAKLLEGTWPRTKYKLLKPRKWRVEFDELLQLNELMREGEMYAPEVGARGAFNSIYGKINQKALNLQTHFRL